MATLGQAWAWQGDNRNKTMLASLRFYWISSKGYRLRPWKSPYIRWRMETFLGSRGKYQTPVEFFALLWRERTGMRRFFAWAEERRKAQSKTERRSAEALTATEEIRQRPR